MGFEAPCSGLANFGDADSDDTWQTNVLIQEHDGQTTMSHLGSREVSHTAAIMNCIIPLL